MTEKSEHFFRYDDIRTRPAFNPDCEISPKSWKRLIGRYTFSEKHICQVRTDKGLCHQWHNNGWLGVTNEGEEALIGCDCAANYFNASSEFIAEKNRVNEELARRHAIERMSWFLSNKLDTAKEFLGLEDNAKKLKESIDRIYNTMPNDVLYFLNVSQKTNNWDVYVDVQYIKYNNDDSYPDDDETEQWVKSHLGKVKSLPFQRDMDKLYQNITQLKKFFNGFIALSHSDIADIKTPKLKSYVKRIDQKEEFANLIDVYQRDIFSFEKLDNLELLVYVCDSTTEQYLTTQALMKITGFKASHRTHIDKRLLAIKDKYENKFQGRLIKKSVS
ncbi:hypothetical protein [Pectobacterium carotovorum]|uniref:hypothetical protein n=1 Tax=Pectobacterium carotovorum TaxID=554 RepID=UPI0021C459E2|nr:hypothetical protein [Pectobacterium carotovorum]GKW07648.1 hypothetical protein PEC301889_21310 [Pectobacterium carotovorum subsp. carotovorum]